MSGAVTRAELERYSQDELIDLVLDFQSELHDLEDEIAEVRDHAGKDRAEIRKLIQEEVGRVKSELDSKTTTLHRERGKVARRVTALEEDLGIAQTDVLATAEGADTDTMTKLGRLIRLGADAVSNNPTAKMRRASVIGENFERWSKSSITNGVRERRLASNRDDLKTRIEDERQERLAWRQVYRAMEVVAKWSEGKVQLKEGRENEGKHVLVHETEVSDR